MGAPHTGLLKRWDQLPPAIEPDPERTSLTCAACPTVVFGDTKAEAHERLHRHARREHWGQP
jgi:hypothetical protein